MDKINKMVSRMAGFKNNVNRDSLHQWSFKMPVFIISNNIINA